ncbi:MAG: FAD binding domain-containing protein [Bacteriovoracaceae bacterium]|nr:FAD binding domain-containing protein [Bacteriovoracaceae bacterium]
MRNSILTYINGERHELKDSQAFMTLSDFLRYQRGLTGTKVVCAEGDCGACTVLVSRFEKKGMSSYQSINSCIAFMWQLDRSHVITVEGLKLGEKFHPVQEIMVSCHGAQCGYCTPGFICAMAGMADEAKKESTPLTEKKVRNALTGNLCRCTGYQSIIEAGMKTDLTNVKPLEQFYNDFAIAKEFEKLSGVHLVSGEQEIYLPVTVPEAVKVIQAVPVKLVSGATDLGVLYNKGKWAPQKMLSLMAIEDLREIKDLPDHVVVGARASLHQVEHMADKYFPEFGKMLHIFASPQIKNSGTLIGNMMNASPIADTIPFLKVAEARVVIAGAQGERKINVNDFFKPGYKQLDISSQEIVTHVEIPKTKNQFKLYKTSKRKDLDISAVTCAISFELEGKTFKKFSLAFGGVGASVLRFPKIESDVIGKTLTPKLMREIGIEVNKIVTPVSDVRGSEAYRRLLCSNLLMKFGDEILGEVNV